MSEDYVRANCGKLNGWRGEGERPEIYFTAEGIRAAVLPGPDGERTIDLERARRRRAS